MGSVPTVQDLLARNRDYAANSSAPKPRLSEAIKADPKWPQALIIACLDSRCNPYEVLGIQSSEAIIIRNAGGRFTPASTDIAGFDRLLDLTQLIILQRNNCASTFLTKDEVLDDVRTKRPEISEAELQELETKLPMRADDENGLITDLQYVRECAFLRRELAEGAIGLYLDVDTGLVKQVKAERR